MLSIFHLLFGNTNEAGRMAKANVRSLKNMNLCNFANNKVEAVFNNEQNELS